MLSPYFPCNLAYRVLHDNCFYAIILNEYIFIQYGGHMGRNEEMNESIRKKRMEEIEGGALYYFAKYGLATIPTPRRSDTSTARITTCC